MRKFYREIEALAEAEGGAGARVIAPPRGRHPRLVWTENGRQIVMIFAATPSDRRALANIRSQLRRMARGEAVRR